MNKEEFIEKVNNELEGNKLSLSERTLTAFYDNVFKGEDTEYTDDFIKQQAELLKVLYGQLHADVAKEMKLNKENWEKEFKNKNIVGTQTKEEEKEIPQFVKDLENKVKALETQLTKASEEKKEDDLRNKLTKAFKEKFAKAGLEVNKFFLKHAFDSVDLGKKDLKLNDVVKELETNYYALLKEANVKVDNVVPYRNNGGGGKGNSIIDDYFKRKADREKNV